MCQLGTLITKTVCPGAKQCATGTRAQPNYTPANIDREYDYLVPLLTCMQVLLSFCLLLIFWFITQLLFLIFLGELHLQ